MIFVTVGTHEQPFNRLLNYIDNLVQKQIITEKVFIQTGFSTYEPRFCEWSKMLSYQDMISKISSARIVITHGGPSSFTLPLRFNKVPIVVPRMKKYNEHVNNHQVEFVRTVSQRRGTIIVAMDLKELESSIINYSCITKNMPNGMKENNKQFINEFSKIVDNLFDYN
ncbi:multidrug MFS transporter [Loigolactobacillus coryniformis]|uniref:glycosyltransferase n=1 Tax=Loigolactobacillus coryniformis TaxID=1610 RepID=UPI00201A8C25|nr:glycosyltransferase [Loigolactobacillus coryniformis]MCL5457526.1 multidrug MFS transporter [Loigolactobacillus coryniformis]